MSGKFALSFFATTLAGAWTGWSAHTLKEDLGIRKYSGFRRFRAGYMAVLFAALVWILAVKVPALAGVYVGAAGIVYVLLGKKRNG